MKSTVKLNKTEKHTKETQNYPLLLKRRTVKGAFDQHTPTKGNRIALIRSRVTKRTGCFFKSNIQITMFKSEIFGPVRCKASVRDKRTVAKYAGIDGYLFHSKRNQLSEELREMKDKLMNYLFTKLNINASDFSKEKSSATKQMVSEYLEKLSWPSNLRN